MCDTASQIAKLASRGDLHPPGRLGDLEYQTDSIDMSKQSPIRGRPDTEQRAAGLNYDSVGSYATRQPLFRSDLGGGSYTKDRLTGKVSGTNYAPAVASGSLGSRRIQHELSR